jgi:hypothetical protein
LRVKRAQSCRDSRSNPDDAFFHVGTKKRNPKFTANKQARTTHCRRAPWMSLTVKFHLFHRRQCVIHDTAPMRKFTVFVHLRLKRMPALNWMWFFTPG